MSHRIVSIDPAFGLLKVRPKTGYVEELRNAGVEITTFADADSAWQHICARHSEIYGVILETFLGSNTWFSDEDPFFSGIRLADKIRGIDPLLKIAFLTYSGHSGAPELYQELAKRQYPAYRKQDFLDFMFAEKIAEAWGLPYALNSAK